MVSYLALKHLHITLVIASLLLFILRGLWMWTGSPNINKRWLKIAPHIVDTALLAAGLTLAVIANFNPAQQPWLAAKLIALIIYIGLGLVTFKAAKPITRRLAFVGALTAAAYMVMAAVSKSPWPL